MTTTTIHFRYGSLKAQVLIFYSDPFMIEGYEFSGDGTIINIYKSKLGGEPSGYFIGSASVDNIEYFINAAYDAKRDFERLEYAIVNPPNLSRNNSDNPDAVY